MAYLGQQLHHCRHLGRCTLEDRLQLPQRVGPRLGRQEAHDRVADTLGLGRHRRSRDGRGQRKRSRRHGPRGACVSISLRGLTRTLCDYFTKCVCVVSN